VGNEKIGGLVTKENFPSLQKANFSGRGAALPICSENLMPELEKVSSGVVFDKRIRALAFAGHDAAKLARQIKEIYLELTEG
jgi:hypothetical protein